MARLVKRFRNQPYEVSAGCGLSTTQPFCDGTHKISESEEPGKLYWYDDAGERYAVAGSDGYYMRSDHETQAA